MTFKRTLSYVTPAYFFFYSFILLFHERARMGSEGATRKSWHTCKGLHIGNPFSANQKHGGAVCCPQGEEPRAQTRDLMLWCSISECWVTTLPLQLASILSFISILLCPKRGEVYLFLITLLLISTVSYFVFFSNHDTNLYYILTAYSWPGRLLLYPFKCYHSTKYSW